MLIGVPKEIKNHANFKSNVDKYIGILPSNTSMITRL